ncbi:hypothetical protein [Amycolatopsis sp. EV170708-02-1]|uniref:hypothetical protein n=1 Tax=Amycolatopsis sp. EV170708-02-1 TaxID=2919322 RepID=UPI001F0BC2C2|nr:hypothetical protein [Amycolatopsis sp. EV170708-02-1]UMP02247.1 hypothetical protein MJQ72_38610 [Amycolatopsis sp. EV170708-02-1]
MARKKTEGEQIGDRVVHTLLSGMRPKDRQAVLGELTTEERQEVLESELDGRIAQWDQTHETKWGES